ncbi:MAG: hypothetical protein ACREM2_03335 [Vulcanimicrobiaceae bacterium]
MSGRVAATGVSAAFFVNSAFAFASAELLTAALHEAGHGVAAQALGFSPHIYAFFEDNPSGTRAQSLLILAAGPLTSLVLGGLFLLWLRRGPPRYSFGRLLLFWLAWLGIMEFVNYLVVTPFLSAGDTAQIADLLAWPLAIRYVIAALGVVLVLLLGRSAAAAMFVVAPGDPPLHLESRRGRRGFILFGFYLPLVAGVVLTALAGIGGRPAMIGFGLLGTFGNIDIVVAAMYLGRPLEASGTAITPAPGALLRVEPAAIVLYLALVALYVFVLAHGLPV